MISPDAGQGAKKLKSCSSAGGAIEMMELPHGGAQRVRNALDALGHKGNFGTPTAAGIDLAREMLEAMPGNAERVMVIVSDGVACLKGKDHLGPHQDALDAADAAGFNIFVLTFNEVTSKPGACTNQIPSGMTKGERNAEFVRGYGQAFETARPEDLDELIVTILREMPYYLVL